MLFMSIIVLTLSACSPIPLQPETVPPEPKIVEIVKEVEVIREVWGTKYVEVPQIIERTINITEFREFENDAVLDAWCQEHLVLNPNWNCVDYAMNLQTEALKDGYIMSIALVRDGQLYGVNVTNLAGGHMGNLVMIKNEIYYVEPQISGYHIRYVVKSG